MLLLVKSKRWWTELGQWDSDWTKIRHFYGIALRVGPLLTMCCVFTAQLFWAKILTGDDWNDGFAEGRFLWEKKATRLKHDRLLWCERSKTCFGSLSRQCHIPHGASWGKTNKLRSSVVWIIYQHITMGPLGSLIMHFCPYRYCHISGLGFHLPTLVFKKQSGGRGGGAFKHVSSLDSTRKPGSKARDSLLNQSGYETQPPWGVQTWGLAPQRAPDTVTKQRDKADRTSVNTRESRSPRPRVTLFGPWDHFRVDGNM